MGKRIHRLSDIDLETMRGVCAHCGETDLVMNGEQPCCALGRSIIAYRKRYKASAHRQHKGKVCERCGFVALIPEQLDVHHRDHDHSNNDPANLETLCVNCHRLEHFAWRWQ